MDGGQRSRTRDDVVQNLIVNTWSTSLFELDQSRTHRTGWLRRLYVEGSSRRRRPRPLTLLDPSLFLTKGSQTSNQYLLAHTQTS